MRKIAKIMLDKERELKMCSRTFPIIEKELKCSMEKINFEQQESMYAMLLGLLIHNNRKMTLDKVYDIVDIAIDKEMEENDKTFMEAFETVLARISEALNEVMGEDTPK